MFAKKILIDFRECLRDKLICKKQRRKLTNHDFTLLSSNCTGAIITHELGCRFNTPTVNLFIKPCDFIKFASDLDSYAQERLVFVEEMTGQMGYPVARLKDIYIYFVHYHSSEDAEMKWYGRYKRINKENLFVLMSERDGCTYQDLKKFDSLPIKNKLVLVKKDYPEIKSAVHIHGFENENQLGDVFRMRRLFGVTKYYDEFDFVAWLNGETK